jgi:hypothetical protein
MKALIYVGSFAMVLVLSFIGAALLFAVMLAFVSFIAWSLPLASPFTWTVFRIISTIAFIIAVLWSFSKENKQFVEELLKDLKGKK